MSEPTCAPFTTLAPHPSQPASPSPDAQGLGLRGDQIPGPLPPGERTELAHYRILRLLGQGGMGKVYQAEDLKLQRVVALKVMHTDMIALATARERFLREARAMAAVRNDHVVTIYEVGQAEDVPYGDVPYLAMEFLQGQTLEKWLLNRGPLAISDIVRRGREIAEGLAAAHSRGLIHRDIKPANIWLEAPTDRVKILDFGLARPAQNASGLTEVGDVIGTPHYMSPEQARGETVDGRSDLFSLGVVLYQLCTRQLPFRGKNVTAVLTALAVDQPTPIREVHAQIPAALADLVMELLAKDPAKRIQSADLVVERLRALEGRLPAALSSFGTPSTASDAVKTPTLGPGALSNTVADLPRGSPTAPARKWPRIAKVGAGITAACLVLALTTFSWLLPTDNKRASVLAGAGFPQGPPIRLGVLYSRTGTMAISERAVLDGVLLAVGEINHKGGVLGRPLEPVIEDGQSDETVFARKAAKLIEADKVSALFGTWTSASRKAVKAIVEQRGHLLFYPISYEGMEQSPNIVYGGSVPNQQMLPALKWSFGFLNKKRWFLVGVDSIYSRAAHAVVRDEAQSMGVRIVGETLLLTADTDVGGLIRRIKDTNPDLIINTMKGDINLAFFRTLRRAGINAAEAPTLSFAVSEEELSSVPPEEIRGHFVAGNYFHSIELPANQEFLQRVQKRFDAERIVSDPLQTSYTLVHLWAQAIESAGTNEVRAVRQAIAGQEYDSPQGRVKIDPGTLHTLQVSRVGVINEVGHFIEAYVSPRLIVPEPFPASRSRAAWERFLHELNVQWGGRWHNPGPSGD